MTSVIHLTRVHCARRWFAPVLAVGTAAIVILMGISEATSAASVQTQVELGTATPFAVLAGTTVTNTGPSIISGDLGVSPGSAVTGFPPGTVINGAIHAADAVALLAQTDLTTAYNDAAGRTPVTVVSADLGGQTLFPGVYQAASSMGLTGTVTLDAQGDPNAVFIFQAGSTLTTASASTVSLINGAQACHVFWQVGSSATLGTGTTFVGSILALTSVSVTTGSTVAGRVLARNGAVTLDTNTITAPACALVPPPTTPPPTTPPPTTPPPTTTPTPTPTTATSSPEPTPRPTGTRSPIPTPRPTGTRSPIPTPGPTGPGFPSGAPETGGGGALPPGNSVLMGVGAAALAGSAAATGLAIRRRRRPTAWTGPPDVPLGGDE
jgi:cell division septation protein DedD